MKRKKIRMNFSSTSKEVVLCCNSDFQDHVNLEPRKIINKFFEVVQTNQKKNCDIFWLDKTPPSSGNGNILNGPKKISRFPGLSTLCEKNVTFHALNRMREFENNENVESKKNRIWILKPSKGSEGRGIQLLKAKDVFDNVGIEDVCVQEYVDPFLINDHKFDLRFYVLITSLNPLKLFVYQNGLVRIATEIYSNKKTYINMNNKFAHLTNSSLNKYNHDVWSCLYKRDFNFLDEYLTKKEIDYSCIYEKIEDLILKTMISLRPFILLTYNNLYKNEKYCKCFHIIGFDIILGKDLNPYLLEINHQPSLSLDWEIDIIVKEQLIRDTISIVGYDLIGENYTGSFKQIDVDLKKGRNILWDIFSSSELRNTFQKFCGIKNNLRMGSSKLTCFTRSLKLNSKKISIPEVHLLYIEITKKTGLILLIF